MNLPKALLFILPLCCGACAGAPAKPENDSIPAEAVLRQIKNELAVYNAYELAHRNDAPTSGACAGKLDFAITNVKIVITTQTDSTADATAGATIPVATGATISPNVELTNDVKNSQTVSFTLFPVSTRRSDQTENSTAYPPAQLQNGQPITWVGFPIALSLEQLRNSLLAASYQAPCFTFAHPDKKDQDNTFQGTFTVTRTAKGGATFKFLIFSLGATATAQTQAANTITVTFAAAPGSQSLIQ